MGAVRRRDRKQLGGRPPSPDSVPTASMTSCDAPRQTTFQSHPEFEQRTGAPGKSSEFARGHAAR